MKRNEQIKQAAIGRYGNNGNESQYMLAKVQAFMVGARWADEHPDVSQIKWQKGEPKTHGRYLVQTKEDGFQIAFWSAYVKTWSLYHNSEIIAWCKLSDIEPYKEKEEQP